jgi:hypothetical protein
METGIFFARRLDRANQLETVRKIRLHAQASRATREPAVANGSRENARRDRLSDMLD